MLSKKLFYLVWYFPDALKVQCRRGVEGRGGGGGCASFWTVFDNKIFLRIKPLVVFGIPRKFNLSMVILLGETFKLKRDPFFACKH